MHDGSKLGEVRVLFVVGHELRANSREGFDRSDEAEVALVEPARPGQLAHLAGGVLHGSDGLHGELVQANAPCVLKA